MSISIEVNTDRLRQAVDEISMSITKVTIWDDGQMTLEPVYQTQTIPAVRNL